MKVLPSLAAADPLRLGYELDRIREWPSLHVDIEDGNFTPNITFGLRTLNAVCAHATNSEIDVHLMVTDPLSWLEHLADKPVKRVAAHIEALPFPMQFINRAHALGMRAGLALNIGSPGTLTEPFWDLVDYILVMTSEPDSAGENLYRPALKKAAEIATHLPAEVELYADGGLNVESLVELNRAGAAGAVMGRHVFSSADPLGTLTALIKKLEKEN